MKAKKSEWMHAKIGADRIQTQKTIQKSLKIHSPTTTLITELNERKSSSISYCVKTTAIDPMIAAKTTDLHWGYDDCGDKKLTISILALIDFSKFIFGAFLFKDLMSLSNNRWYFMLCCLVRISVISYAMIGWLLRLSALSFKFSVLTLTLI